MLIPLTLSSLLLYLAYPNFINIYGFDVTAWFFAVPLFSTLDGEPLKKRILIGGLFGLMTLSLQLNWLIAYNFLGYIALVLILTLQPIFFAIFYPSQFKNKYITLLYVPAAWAASEYLRPLLFHGFSWTIGHTQSQNVPVLQIASLLGSHSISFVLILINFCLYKLFKNTRDKLFYWGTIFLTLIIVLGYGHVVTNRNKTNHNRSHFYNITLIQANINSHDRKNPDLVDHILDKHIALSKKSSVSQKADLIIWPETAIPDDILTDPIRLKKIKNLAVETNANLLIGSALFRNQQTFNSVVLFDKTGIVRKIYDKIHLVPFTEYTPSNTWLKFLSAAFDVQNDEFVSGQQLGLFPLDITLQSQFGVSICSEDSYPLVFRNFAEEDILFAVVLLNDGWFRQDEALIMHAQHSVMRSVENRLPIVRSSNTGWSGTIDQFGRMNVKESLPLNQAGFTHTSVLLNKTPNLYTQIGDIFAVICIGFVIINFVIGVIKRMGKT